MRVIKESGVYRIIELPNTDYCMENLKGDIYCPKVNTDISPKNLKRQEIEFERLVFSEGVYGYELQKWNSEVGKGWEHLDSCWGFVGAYKESEEEFNHYIVNEFISEIS